VDLTSSPPELTIFVPTRGRPDNLADFAGEFYRYASCRTKVVFVFDEDDRDLARYISKNDNRWEYYVAGVTRRGMVGALNEAFRHYAKSGKLGFAVGFMGDDHRPRTPDWDKSYIDVLRGLQTGFVYGNDLFQFDRIPTQISFTTDIALAVGYMCPPEMDHLCVDVVWKDWGTAIDKIQYLEDVVIEHMHPLAGKNKNDKQYRAVNSNFMARHDNDAYLIYHDPKGREISRFQEDVGKIKMMMEFGYIEGSS